MTCEYCAEVTNGRPVPAPTDGVVAEPSDASAGKHLDDTRRRGVVARLRERYGDARGLVSREQAYPQPHAHLEWILGTQRNLRQDEAAFETGVSELVVLWLQDLALELDNRTPQSAADSGDIVTSAAHARDGVARDLRTATHDFAEAFLSPRPSSVG
jgi:hypothetical protein